METKTIKQYVRTRSHSIGFNIKNWSLLITPLFFGQVWLSGRDVLQAV